MTQAGEQGVWSNRKLLLQAELIVVGKYGIEPVYKVLKQVRDDQAAASPTLSAPTDDLAKWQGYLDTIAELRAQLRHAQQATLSAQSVAVIREALEAERNLLIAPSHKAAIDAALAELDAQRHAQSVTLAVGTPEHNAVVKALESAISELSEGAYSAQWIIDCEYAIWQDLQVGVPGQFFVGKEQSAQLRALSSLIGGWVFWDDESSEVIYVPRGDWLAMYTTWLKRQRPAPKVRP